MLQTSRADVLQSLKQQLRRISGADSPVAVLPAVTSTGIAALDALLPQRGISRGGMVEWLTPGAGAGAASLALVGVRAALAQGGRWVVIDLRGDFFPAAVIGWGVPLERLLVLRPATARDAAWAFEQTLRCAGVSVAWHWADKASERALRRWKVAAETGGGQGVLFRPLTSHRETSWADVRWQVHTNPTGKRGDDEDLSPLAHRADVLRSAAEWRESTRHPSMKTLDNTARRLHVELAYCRGVLGGKHVDLEYDDETGRVCLVAALADSTTVARTARA